MDVPLKAAVEAAALNFGVSKKVYLWISQNSEKNSRKVMLMEKIGEAVGHSSRVWMLIDDSGNSLIFHGQLEGFPWLSHEGFIGEKYRGTGLGNKVDYFVEQQARLKCEFFVITKMDELKKSADLIAFLRGNFREVRQDPEVLIFDLREAAGNQEVANEK